LDFVYGASRSQGGKPIIALPSTATMRDGTVISRIVAMLKPGAGVVTTRNHVHYVATEYGVAHLYGKSIQQRARALIDIAHPSFQEQLEKVAAELRYL
jgi:acetyl-CoA hydrolase